jgi:dUTP pyrophosphatase
MKYDDMNEVSQVATDVFYDEIGCYNSCHVVCLQKHPDAKLPVFAFKNDGCADLYSVEDKWVFSKEKGVIDTGLAVEIPDGWEGLIMSRSGLAAKNGVFVLNAPGVIDASYRGNIKIILFNTGNEDFKIASGDRIAQIAVRRVPNITFKFVDKLSESKRGQGGLGSTGMR